MGEARANMKINRYIFYHICSKIRKLANFLPFLIRRKSPKDVFKFFYGMTFGVYVLLGFLNSLLGSSTEQLLFINIPLRYFEQN